MKRKRERARGEMSHERAYLSWPWRRNPICCEEEREKIWVLGFGLEREERERERERERGRKEKRKKKRESQTGCLPIPFSN